MKNRLLRNSIIFTVFVIILEAFIYFYLDRFVAHGATGITQGPVYIIAQISSAYVSQYIWALVLAFCLVVSAIQRSYDSNSVWAKKMMYVALTVVIAATIGFALRFLLGRYSPMLFVQKGEFGFQFFGRGVLMTSMPAFYGYYIFAAMFALGAICRKYAIFFILFATLIAVSRVFLNVHYLTDVILGAYVGVLVAIWTYRLMFGHTNFDPEFNKE